MALIKTNARSATALDATILTGNLPAINGSALTNIDGGITGIDAWGLSSTASHSSGGVTISSNWTRRTTHASSNLGTAMTESSGVFTFPSTGHWLVLGGFFFDGNASTHYRGIIMKNNAGTNITLAYGHGQGSNPSWDHDAVSVHFNMDVTDTTADTNKIYFQTNSGATCTVAGGSNGQSYVSFIRLGDT